MPLTATVRIEATIQGVVTETKGKQIFSAGPTEGFHFTVQIRPRDAASLLKSDGFKAVPSLVFEKSLEVSVVDLLSPLAAVLRNAQGTEVQSFLLDLSDMVFAGAVAKSLACDASNMPTGFKSASISLKLSAPVDDVPTEMMRCTVLRLSNNPLRHPAEHGEFRFPKIVRWEDVADYRAFKVPVLYPKQVNPYEGVASFDLIELKQNPALASVKLESRVQLMRPDLSKDFAVFQGFRAPSFSESNTTLRLRVDRKAPKAAAAAAAAAAADAPGSARFERAIIVTEAADVGFNLALRFLEKDNERLRAFAADKRARREEFLRKAKEESDAAAAAAAAAAATAKKGKAGAAPPPPAFVPPELPAELREAEEDLEPELPAGFEILEPKRRIFLLECRFSSGPSSSIKRLVTAFLDDPANLSHNPLIIYNPKIAFDEPLRSPTTASATGPSLDQIKLTRSVDELASANEALSFKFKQLLVQTHQMRDVVRRGLFPTEADISFLRGLCSERYPPLQEQLDAQRKEQERLAQTQEAERKHIEAIKNRFKPGTRVEVKGFMDGPFRFVSSETAGDVFDLVYPKAGGGGGNGNGDGGGDAAVGDREPPADLILRKVLNGIVQSSDGKTVVVAVRKIVEAVTGRMHTYNHAYIREKQELVQQTKRKDFIMANTLRCASAAPGSSRRKPDMELPPDQEVFIYSSQALNITELQRAALARRLQERSQKEGVHFTYSKHFLSASVPLPLSPVEGEGLADHGREKFSLFKPRPASEFLQHPKKPDSAVCEELSYPWIDPLDRRRHAEKQTHVAAESLVHHERPFTTALGSQSKLFDSAITSHTNPSTQEVFEKRESVILDWQSKVIVKTSSMQPAGRPTGKTGNLLHDEPQKMSLKTAAATTTTGPLFLSSQAGPFVDRSRLPFQQNLQTETLRHSDLTVNVGAPERDSSSFRKHVHPPRAFISTHAPLHRRLPADGNSTAEERQDDGEAAARRMALAASAVTDDERRRHRHLYGLE